MVVSKQSSWPAGAMPGAGSSDEVRSPDTRLLAGGPSLVDAHPNRNELARSFHPSQFLDPTLLIARPEGRVGGLGHRRMLCPRPVSAGFGARGLTSQSGRGP